MCNFLNFYSIARGKENEKIEKLLMDIFYDTKSLKNYTFDVKLLYSLK